jgi:hypothetical protein
MGALADSLQIGLAGRGTGVRLRFAASVAA